MKKIEAIIKPFKLEDVKEKLAEKGYQRTDGNGDQRLRQAERAYRTLSRCRVFHRFPAENQNRSGRHR